MAALEDENAIEMSEKTAEESEYEEDTGSEDEAEDQAGDEDNVPEVRRQTSVDIPPNIPAPRYQNELKFEAYDRFVNGMTEVDV